MDSISKLLYLLRGESSPDKREQYIAAAESELGRISDIANHTLRFYRDPVGLAEVDLAEMIESTLALFQPRIVTAGVQIERNLPKGLCVEGTAGEIRQVAANLINNALDAMPKGGRRILRARPFGSSTYQHQNVRLTIADSGHGMTASVQERHFQLFYTTRGEQGNGLGLWLSLEILKKHRATLKLKSAPKYGTGFVISFLRTTPLLSACERTDSAFITRR